jgi:hypothetical protein
MQERRTMLPESLRAVANMLEEMQRVQKLTESRLSCHGADLQDLKAELQRQIYVQERQAKEIHKLKQELESLRSACGTHEPADQKEAAAALSNPDTAKASAQGVPLTQQDVIKAVSSLPQSERFYNTAAVPRNAPAFITSSIPLGRDTQVQPNDSGTSGQTAAPVSASSKEQTGSSDQKAPKKAAKENSQPILPGSGFSHITIDYLRKLGEK